MHPVGGWILIRDAYREIVDAWHGFGITDAKRLAAYLENFSVVFAYNSAAIENPRVTYRDTHEIFENGKVVGYTGDLKTLFEIQNMKDAYALTTNWFDESRPIAINMILELHRELTKGTYDERRWDMGERPGAFRINDIWGVGRHDIAAPVSEIEHDLEIDLAEIADVDDEDALAAASFFHARFEGVHPFADGNGRVGRALMNYFLLLHDHPPVVVYEEDKASYYEALDRFDQTGDLKALTAFLEEQLEKTWRGVLERYNATRAEIERPKEGRSDG